MTTFQKWLASLNLTQSEIAEKTGFSQPKISYDKKNNTGTKVIIEYAEAMGKKEPIKVEGIDFGKEVTISIIF